MRVFTAVIDEYIDVFGECHAVRNMVPNQESTTQDLETSYREVAQRIADTNSHRELISVTISAYRDNSLGCFTYWQGAMRTYKIEELKG